MAKLKLTQAKQRWPGELYREGSMRRLLAAIFIMASIVPAVAATSFASTEEALRWINDYRTQPKPNDVPGVILFLGRQGAFREPESAGIYPGFIAGVLGSNSTQARSLVSRMTSLSFADQWVLIKAVAYSETPNWKETLRWLATRLPDRKVMIERYLSGNLPTLNQIALERTRLTTMQKVKSAISFSKEKTPLPETTFESNPELIDTLWGVYFATGGYSPIERLVWLLSWANDRDSVEKLTIGSMAKYTLANNASRDAKLLTLLKRKGVNQPKQIETALKEVIEAAENSDTGRLRKEALAALEELKKKGPEYKRNIAWWGTAGETAISAGCLAAAVTGQVAMGLPCVLGGALSSAALKHLAAPE
jgi:hypothetical protein